jgi:DNA (cytosine-5)-methyltransferase 1
LIQTIKPIFFDLFCGAGGLSKGLCEAGLQVGAAVEIDPVAISTFEKNIGVKVINKDILEVKGGELLKHAKIKKGELFLLAGCPPCQGFSQIRNKDEGLKDKRNQLVFEFVRLVKEIEPIFLLMENVPGITRKSGKKILNAALDELSEKYFMKHAIVNAADYGVPQTRKRFILHGIRLDVYKKKFSSTGFDLPKKTHSSINDDQLKPWKTAEVIRDLPPINAGEKSTLQGLTNHIACKMSELNLKRIRYIHENGYLPDNLRPPCHKKAGINYTDVYNVMHWDKPAPTITGGFNYFSKGRFGHPEQDRALTAREAARLQTFEDNYEFFGNMIQVSKQIGNAVPPLLAYKSGEYFLNFWKQRKMKM